MLLVWGFRTYVTFLGVVTLVCGRCHNPAAQRLSSRVRKFTLFWIPLFPVSKKTVMTCTFCGTTSALTDQQAAMLMSQPAEAQVQQQSANQAGAQYPAQQYPAQQYPTQQAPASQWPAEQYPAPQPPAIEQPSSEH